MKTKLVIIASIIIFLMLSAALTTPIKAAIKVNSNSSNSSPKITPLPDGLEIGGTQITQQNISSTKVLMTITSPTGSVTTVDINRNGTDSSITVNGVTTLINAAIPSSAMQSTNNAVSAIGTTQSSAMQSTNNEPQTISQIISSLTHQTASNQTVSPASTSISPSSTSQPLSEPESSGLSTNSMQAMDDPETYVSGVNYYVWDGLNFVSGSGIAYPHDDRAYYSISPNATWSDTGNQLFHAQVQSGLASYFFYLYPTLADTIISEVIVDAVYSAVGGPAGFALGLIISIVTAVYDLIQLVYNSPLDEDGCAWFWVGQTFFNDLVQNWANLQSDSFSSAVSIVLGYYDSDQYLRVGGSTYHNNLGIFSPTITPQYWANSIPYEGVYSYPTAGWAPIYYPSSILGKNPDGTYSNICALQYKSLGYIITELNSPGSGEVYISGYSDYGYASDFYVYVSPDDSHWYQLYNNYIRTNTPYFIDCGNSNGVYDGPINYVMVLGYDNGAQTSLELDSIQLILHPTLTFYVYDEYPVQYPYGYYWGYDTDLAATVEIDNQNVGTVAGSGPLTCTIANPGSHSMWVPQSVYDYSFGSPPTTVVLAEVLDGNMNYYYYIYGNTNDPFTVGNINYNMIFYIVYQYID